MFCTVGHLTGQWVFRSQFQAFAATASAQTGPVAEEQVLHVRTFAMGRAKRSWYSGRCTGSARCVRGAAPGVSGAPIHVPAMGERGVRVVEPAEPRHRGLAAAARPARVIT